MTEEGGFPNYSYTDELKGPAELGIRRDGSFRQISNALAGVNYYVDALGFAEPTTYTKFKGGAFTDQKPLGIRYFAKTGTTCSNGASMYEYIDTIPKGRVFGERIVRELNNMGLPRLRGLAPGIVEDGLGAMNPVPLYKAATGGYPKCKKQTARVGSETYPYFKSRLDPKSKNVWITGPTTVADTGIPYQTRWVLDEWVSQEEWDCTPKTEADKGLKEGFEGDLRSSRMFAAILLSLVGLGIVAVISRRK